MRIKFIKEIIDKQRTINEVSSLLSVSRQSVSKWISKFKIEWESWIAPKKCWPKYWNTYNRTSLLIENIVIDIARNNILDWPVFLAKKLEEQEWLILNQSTIYRILKRNNIRYKERWEWKRRRKTLYVLDDPWREVQVDACFPFWRKRKEVQYDAIDDCSRFVFSKLHTEHCVRSSMEFVWNLVRNVPFRISRIRTDQWMEFWPWFTKYLESIWIEHIRNAPYSPQHNWKVERYHRTLWRWLWTFDTYIDVHEYRLRLKLFVDWYNYKKPHLWLWMFWMTPAEKIWYCILNDSLEKSLWNVNLTLQFNILNSFFTKHFWCKIKHCTKYRSA